MKIDLEKFWEQVKRLRKDEHTPCLHFCTARYGFDLYNSNPKEFRYDLVWDKGSGVSFLSANRQPMRSHELVYIFSKAGAYYTRIDITGDFKFSAGGRDKSGQSSRQYGDCNKIESKDNTGKRCPTSVLRNPNKKKKGGHPTEKPVELYKFLIERYSPAGGTVLDPTFGSGNSGRACAALGRKWIGIEKDKGFFDTFIAAQGEEEEEEEEGAVKTEE